MNCPKCRSTERIKSGIIRQRYQCKECGCHSLALMTQQTV